MPDPTPLSPEPTTPLLASPYEAENGQRADPLGAATQTPVLTDRGLVREIHALRHAKGRYYYAYTHSEPIRRKRWQEVREIDGTLYAFGGLFNEWFALRDGRWTLVGRALGCSG